MNEVVKEISSEMQGGSLLDCDRMVHTLQTPPCPSSAICGSVACGKKPVLLRDESRYKTFHCVLFSILRKWISVCRYSEMEFVVWMLPQSKAQDHQVSQGANTEGLSTSFLQGADPEPPCSLPYSPPAETPTAPDSSPAACLRFESPCFFLSASDLILCLLHRPILWWEWVPCWSTAGF